jgi:hypothetical protein
VLTTNQKGALAETAIAHAAVKAGIAVFVPLGEHRYDLVIDVRGRLFRVQCKTAPRYGDVFAVRCYSSRRQRGGFVKQPYWADEVDLIAVYAPDPGRCYLLPPSVFSGRSQVQLRLGPARNNQQLGVKWAHDFEFVRVDWAALGAIAQLGERRDGIAKVAGSSPAGSIH